MFALEIKWGKEVKKMQLDLKQMSMNDLQMKLQKEFGLKTCKVIGFKKKKTKFDESKPIADECNVNTPLQKIGVIGTRESLLVDEIPSSDFVNEELNYDLIVGKQSLQIRHEMEVATAKVPYKRNFRNADQETNQLRDAQKISFAGDICGLQAIWEPDFCESLKEIVSAAIYGNQPGVIIWLETTHKIRDTSAFPAWAELCARYGHLQAFIAVIDTWKKVENVINKATSNEKIDDEDMVNFKIRYLKHMANSHAVNQEFASVDLIMLMLNGAKEGHLLFAKNLCKLYKITSINFNHPGIRSKLQTICNSRFVQTLAWLLKTYWHTCLSQDYTHLARVVLGELFFSFPTENFATASLNEVLEILLQYSHFAFVVQSDVEWCLARFEDLVSSDKWPNAMILHEFHKKSSHWKTSMFASFSFQNILVESRLPYSFVQALEFFPTFHGSGTWDFLSIEIRRNIFKSFVKQQARAQDTWKLLELFYCDFVSFDDIFEPRMFTEKEDDQQRNIILRALKERLENEMFAAHIATDFKLSTDMGIEVTRIILEYVVNSNGRKTQQYQANLLKFSTFVDSLCP